MINPYFKLSHSTNCWTVCPKLPCLAYTAFSFYFFPLISLILQPQPHPLTWPSPNMWWSFSLIRHQWWASISLSRLSSRFPETTHFPTTTTTSRNLDFFFFFFFCALQATYIIIIWQLFKISSSPNWEPPRTIYSLIVVSLAPRDHYMFNGRIISGKRK